MKRIRFTADAEYKCIPGPVFYRAGSVHDMRDDLAARWVRRGVAVELPPAPFAALVTALIPAEDDGGPIISTEFDGSAPAEQVYGSVSGGVLTLSADPEPDPAQSPFIPTEPRRRGRPPKRLA